MRLSAFQVLLLENHRCPGRRGEARGNGAPPLACGEPAQSKGGTQALTARRTPPGDQPPFLRHLEEEKGWRNLWFSKYMPGGG